MTGQQILQANILDILFEHRNKAYGAYALRKTYPLRLIKAVSITILFVFVLLFFGSSSSTKTKIDDVKDGYVVRTVNLQDKKLEPPKEKPAPPATHQLVKQEIYETQLKVVDEVKQTMPTQDQLQDVTFGNQKVDGIPATNMQPPPLPPANNGNGNVQAEPEQKENILPNRQPQFPGGADAWRNFLNRYLQSPQDLEPGEKRTVVVRFWVDEEGNVTNFQVVQSGGPAFDNEVIRVLKKMPKWLPAIQNGRPVAISFTQPVTFTAVEE